MINDRNYFDRVVRDIEYLKRKRDVGLSRAQNDEERAKVHSEYEANLNRIQEKAAFGLTAIWGSAGLVVLGFLAFWVLSNALTTWDELPHLFVSPANCGLAAIMSILVGWLFFQLRRTVLWAYASLELALALGASFKAAIELPKTGNTDRLAYLFALMGSVYIAVRAFDNFDRWFHPEKEKVRAIVKEALSESATLDSVPTTNGLPGVLKASV